MSLAAIHIKKKELGLTDQQYRNLLDRVAGVRSAKDLTPEGDLAVMRALYAMERKPRPQMTPQAGKIWALWYTLKTFLPADRQNAAYLTGIVNHAAGTVIRSASEFSRLTTKEAKKAIDALKQRVEYEENKLKEEVPF